MPSVQAITLHVARFSRDWNTFNSSCFSFLIKLATVPKIIKSISWNFPKFKSCCHLWRPLRILAYRSYCWNMWICPKINVPVILLIMSPLGWTFRTVEIDKLMNSKCKMNILLIGKENIITPYSIYPTQLLEVNVIFFHLLPFYILLLALRAAVYLRSTLLGSVTDQTASGGVGSGSI